MIAGRFDLPAASRGLITVALVALLVGCGGAQHHEQSQELQGAPPTAKEDPFFFVAMPAEAKPAETSGTIGDEEEEPPPPRPPEGAPEPPPKTSPDQVQCFSCVKICAVDDPRCEGSEDVICGWGVDRAPEQASKMASAQCDGALDLARETPRWGRIEGDCPVATCR